MLSDVSLCLLTANGEIGIVERFLFKSASVGWLYGNDGGASRRVIGG